VPPRPDRLPLIVLSLVFVALALGGVGAVYTLGKLIPSHDVTSGTSAAPTSAEATTVSREPRRAPAYAGLTPDRAARFAVLDFAPLLGTSGQSGADIGTIATTGKKLGRTRCYHAGHWNQYWRVSFAGGSPIFESRKQALVFCNRNPHVI